ncbi:hypothetical protein [Polynucleobacter sp.]|uniref:hypothetical protein n=1 Tax=Polynucleobacter sp. TaxID=2029855 RepID=UPI0026093F65|nr:hypothetical protein [Polynucleobacter sp.]MCW1965161.1 hypothetical protein [Polynucleobacter sp.]
MSSSDGFLMALSDSDWDFWLLRPKIYSFEAAALVCNMDPEMLGTEYSGREWHFHPFDWDGKEKEFRQKFTLIDENSEGEGFNLHFDKVDLRGFAVWAKLKTGWKLPKRLEEFADKAMNQRVSEVGEDKAKSARESSNELKLIGALLETLIDKSGLDSQAKVIAFLEAEFKELGGFSKSHLEKKFAEANDLFQGSK